MTFVETMQQMIEELGPSTDEILVVHQADQDAWDVFFEEGVCVSLDWVEDQTKLVLSMDLGSPPQECVAKTCEILLTYNSNWANTGGIKMGLSAPGGVVEMMFDLNAANLELQTLRDVLLSFHEKGVAWSALIAAGLGGSAPAEEAMDELLGAIRV